MVRFAPPCEREVRVSVDAFAALVAEFEERTLPRPTPRAVELPGLPGKADALVGMRRVGKTWRLFQHMADLLDQGVARERLLYVNLEDERLSVDASELSGLTEAWYARHPSVVGQEHWLYLDEVQNVPGWERFVRRLLDQVHVRVLVTGSSSKMLSAEIATSLRGRALSTEVLPFSFAEALVHAGTTVPHTWPVGPSARARLAHAFDAYLESGGFPEVQGLDADLRRRVLQEYVDVAVLRDIVERHGVTQVHALRWLVRRLLANPSGRFSANRLHRDLRSQGHAIGKDSVHELLAHVEDAHLVYTVPLWSASAARRQIHPRKAYPVDPALSRTVAFAKPEDVGHRLESLVYLELRRRGLVELGYVDTEAGFEVDFCGRQADGTPHLVQVCAQLSDEDTRRRELRALEAAMAELGIAAATLVTLREEEVVRLPTGTVRVVPAWRWLLEPTGVAG
ncbi:MAG: ATP-binding protein [Alphaproteobacteria bacterium]|nr:ATP-binding protein [Alphaproteobacteria bacterium]